MSVVNCGDSGSASRSEGGTRELSNFLRRTILDSIYVRQYGFRAGRSREHTLLDAQNTILDSLNSKHIPLLLLIDFSKAFDLVDHDILLSKLNHYGIRGIQTQFVTINGSNS